MKAAACSALICAVIAASSLVAAPAPTKGEIRVTTPSIPAAKRFEPLEVAFEVRPPAGAGTIEASLILTSLGGKPRTYAARTADGKTFRVTAIPSQPEDSNRVRVTWIDGTTELVFESPDRVLTAGGKDIKLSEIRLVELRDDPRVVTRSGEALRGRLGGLDQVQAQVGGKALQLEPGKGERLLINRVESALPLVDYRIVARRKNQIIAETSGRIEFTPDLPPPPLPRSSLPIAFAPAKAYDVPDAADIVTAGDLDGDRFTDVVIGGGEGLGVLYGRGDGRLEPFARLLTWKARPANRLLLDLNRDRLPEILFFDTLGRLVILENQGGRRFAEPRFQTFGRANKVCAADFDKDGRIDVAMTVDGDYRGEVKVLFGEPDGTFREQSTMRVAGNADGIAAGDVDGDGWMDLAVGNGTSTVNTSGAVVFLGAENGKFKGGPSSRIGTGNMPGIALEDLNGDGKPDLVVTDYRGGKLAVHLNKGDGKFSPYEPYPAGPYPVQIKAADFDGDGKPDLAIPNAGASQLSILRNRGDGTFHDTIIVPTEGGDTRSCAVADLNRDGRPDLIVQTQASKAVTVLLNIGGK